MNKDLQGCRVMSRASRVDVDEEASTRVDPILKVVRVVVIRVLVDVRTSRESVCSSVLRCWNVNELEVEEENGRNPAVDCVVRVHGGIVDHPLDELSVHLNDKLLGTDGVELSLLQGTK
jgi:hypothetical protein